ncbi:MAG TPA: DUF4349 domain-containing protein [Pyrinomonadaceae bacterium]|nr:DUF4349 domain-containing protein [Pyrinomonadaceae bacterium]
MAFRKAILLVALLSCIGCNSASKPAQVSTVNNEPEKAFGDSKDLPKTAEHGVNEVSLRQIDQTQTQTAAMERKIVRNAELSLEVDVPAEAQRKIGTIANSLGGFVVTSESKQHQTTDGKQQLEVNLVVRVPENQFDAALNQIRATGSRVVQEKTTGEDVTEEFIDVEARLKTQKALELQFLEIMKQAHKVEDALEVQSQIADVRGEIEKLEGRKRFLENRASLSTITISVTSPGAIVVNPSGFGRSVREAVSESVDFAVSIVLFLIRFVMMMIPFGLLVLLPLYLIGRFVYRRTWKAKTATVMEPQAGSAS